MVSQTFAQKKIWGDTDEQKKERLAWCKVHILNKPFH